jgi:uncharacterized protein DUF4372/DDE family transposase
MNTGKTMFAQIMEFVPWTSFTRIVARHSGDSGVRCLSCTEQFRAMAFAQLTYRESLRDIEACLLANQSKLYGMGFRTLVRRSTLADANEGRDWRIWADLTAVLIRRARKLYCNDSFGVELANTVYALDATTIDLCLSLFPWAPFRSTKAAVKLHTLLDLRGSIPAFIHVSDGKTHEVSVLDMLPVEAGAFYLMDRGYLDFSRLYALHQARAFFVTRAKRGMNARPAYSMPTDRGTGMICDQRIALNGHYSAKAYPEQLRRIRFKDPESGKSRWRVELFFKWIKQHLRIKRFIGNSENAVKTQIWCAIATYVLIAIVKKELQVDASLYTLLQILSVSVFEKTQLQQAFAGTANILEQTGLDNQLNLFEF